MDIQIHGGKKKNSKYNQLKEDYNFAYNKVVRIK